MEPPIRRLAIGFCLLSFLRVVRVGTLIAGLEVGIAEPFHMAGAPLGVIVIITNL